MSQTWTLLRTVPATLPRYSAFITERYPSIELYYPQHETLSRPSGHRRPHRVQRPTFPGYIFARPDFSNGEHNALKLAPFRVWFIRFGPDIEIIPDSVIAEIRRLETTGQLAPPIEKPRTYHPGQRVQVHLPTISIIGIIKRIMQIRVIVETDHVSITVPIHQINHV